MAIGLTKHTDLTMDRAHEAVRTALAEEGFGILTEIDVQATLKEKLDVDRPPLKILGACNPSLAHQALSKDEESALLLPCNVTLSDHGDGTTVTIVDPVVLLDVVGTDEELRTLAADARTRLARALAQVPVA